jgi:hypothetical protein
MLILRYLKGVYVVRRRGQAAQIITASSMGEVLRQLGGTK